MVFGKRKNTGQGTLSPTKTNDGKWHLIGMIKESNLQKLSVDGFDDYQSSIDSMESYGYTLFIG